MDIIKKKKKALRETHMQEFESLEKYSSNIRLAQHLYLKAKEFFGTCSVSWNEGTQYHSISVYLDKNYNITEHVNVFVDEWMHVLKNFMYDWQGDYKIDHDEEYSSMDYKFGCMSLYFYYGEGRCERVKIGTTNKTITKDVYEIQCY